jgi:hypothetical protein
VVGPERGLALVLKIEGNLSSSETDEERRFENVLAGVGDHLVKGDRLDTLKCMDRKNGVG